MLPTLFNAFKKNRARIHEIIYEADTRAGRAFDVVLFVAILASVLVILLDSMRALQEMFHLGFVILEWTFTILFTREYALRLWCVNRPIKYVFSFYGLTELYYRRRRKRIYQHTARHLLGDCNADNRGLR